MDEALTRVSGAQLAQLMFPTFDIPADAERIASGMSASPGAAVGKAVFDANRAEELAGTGERVILVRRETNPDDLNGMIAAQGVLTSRGVAGLAAAAGEGALRGAHAVQVVRVGLPPDQDHPL